MNITKEQFITYKNICKSGALLSQCESINELEAKYIVANYKELNEKYEN